MSKLPQLPLIDAQLWLLRTYSVARTSKGKINARETTVVRKSDIGPVFPPITRRPLYDSEPTGRKRRKKRGGVSMRYLT